MTKIWADKPYDLLATPTVTQMEGISKEVAAIATEMTLAHNLILRGLNSIYLQADNISQSEDISDFLHYCKAWYLTIHHHHEGEEKYLFPAIAEYTGEKDIMDTNIAQHEVFDEGVEGLNEYLENATPETYDGKLVKSKIEGFAPALQTHLKEEIATLLGLEKYGGKNLAKSWAYLHKKVFAEMTNKSLVFPLGFGANDKTFEGGVHYFPPVPFFVPYMVDWVYGRKYRGAWRFCPCDAHGIPRPLSFVSKGFSQ